MLYSVATILLHLDSFLQLQTYLALPLELCDSSFKHYLSTLLALPNRSYEANFIALTDVMEVKLFAAIAGGFLCARGGQV